MIPILLIILIFNLTVVFLSISLYPSIANSKKEALYLEVASNIDILEAYCGYDLSYIKQTINENRHPHINIIKENFNTLIELVDKKKIALNATIDEHKIETLTNEINLIINKYVELVHYINNNLVEEKIIDLKKLNDELLNDRNQLNDNTMDIEDFIKICNDSLKINKKIIWSLVENKLIDLKDYNEENFNINGYSFVRNGDIPIKLNEDFLCNLLESINPSSFNNYCSKYESLKKLLRNKNTPYYNSIENMFFIIIDYITSLNKSKEFLHESLTILIDQQIECILLNYIELLTVLDKRWKLPNDNNIENYTSLLDEIVRDIKNKKAIF